jgi:uncharacterized protein (DUF433 family)
MSERDSLYCHRGADVERLANANSVDLHVRHEDTMTRDEILARITFDPGICSGKPCIRGHRIEVSSILDLLANGWSSAEILTKYPDLEEADIHACIAYGTETTWERDILK